MARGGNNRVPSAQKKMRGTWRADRASASEPLFAPLERRCPSWLPHEAKRLWRYLAPMLAASGVLQEPDLPAFELMCLSYAEARMAGEELANGKVLTPDPAHKAADGSVPLRKNPALQIIRDATATFTSLACRFGLTPTDRAKLKLPETAPEDEFTAFLNKKQGNG